MDVRDEKKEFKEMLERTYPSVEFPWQDEILYLDSSYFFFEDILTDCRAVAEEICKDYEVFDKNQPDSLEQLEKNVDKYWNSCVHFSLRHSHFGIGVSNDKFDECYGATLYLHDEIKKKKEEWSKIFQDEADTREYREYRKENRGRWTGGGYGIKGAISGAVKAEIMNAIGGTIHTAVNTVENHFTAKFSEQKRKKIFEEFDIIPLYYTRSVLQDFKKEIIENTRKKYPGLMWEKNKSKERQALDILEKAVYIDKVDKKECDKLVCGLLQLNPFSVDIYCDIIEIYLNVYHFEHTVTELQKLARLVQKDLTNIVITKIGDGISEEYFQKVIPLSRIMTLTSLISLEKQNREELDSIIAENIKRILREGNDEELENMVSEIKICNERYHIEEFLEKYSEEFDEILVTCLERKTEQYSGEDILEYLDILEHFKELFFLPAHISAVDELMNELVDE